LFFLNIKNKIYININNNIFLEKII